MGNKKAVRNAINRTFSAEGGVFWQAVRDSQLNEYWLTVLEEHLNWPLDVQNRKKAALSLGKQRDEEVYVLGENIQVRLNKMREAGAHKKCCF